MISSISRRGISITPRLPSNLTTNQSRAGVRFTTKVTPMLLNAVADGITAAFVAQENLTSGDSLGTKLA